jgi:hypothetical protein
MTYEDIENKERLVQEYLNNLSLMDTLKKQIESIKSALSKDVDSEGEEDDKGHRWLKVGPYLLQRQRRQGASSLDRDATEQWAKERGIWEKVSKVVEVLDEDALMAYAYEHRDDDDVQAEVQALYKEAPVSYAFIKPVEEDSYDY